LLSHQFVHDLDLRLFIYNIIFIILWLELYGVASYSNSTPSSSKEFNYLINSRSDALLNNNKAQSNDNATSINANNSSSNSNINRGVKVITSIESFYDAYDCMSMKSDEGLQKGM